MCESKLILRVKPVLSLFLMRRRTEWLVMVEIDLCALHGVHLRIRLQRIPF